jgi:hypothetical protein
LELLLVVLNAPYAFLIESVAQNLIKKSYKIRSLGKA